MSNRHRFLLDEHIHLAVAEGLRRLDLDVLHVCESDLRGIPDELILTKPVELNRILVTRDIRDFSRIAQLFISIERPFPGILLVPPSTFTTKCWRHQTTTDLTTRIGFSSRKSPHRIYILVMKNKTMNMCMPPHKLY